LNEIYCVIRCGYGGEGEPVDATDACCKSHDQCYNAIVDSRANLFSCSPYFSIYTWELDLKTQLPVCKDQTGSCAHKVCECDRIVTDCYKQNIDTFNKSLQCLR
jgi:secretory phospholipase A2